MLILDEKFLITPLEKIIEKTKNPKKKTVLSEIKEHLDSMKKWNNHFWA